MSQPRAPRKACDACHNIKIRCVPGNASTCQRCARLEIQCKHSSRAPRKQKIRADARVASLEKEIERLRTSLSASNALGSSDARASPPQLQSPAIAECSDDADEMLRTYVKDYAHRCPAVRITDLDHGSLSIRRPLLAKTILAVVSAAHRPSIVAQVQNEIFDLCVGSVSSAVPLDLIEAVLVDVTFFTPPLGYTPQTNSFYQLTHLAFATVYSLNVETPDADLERARVYVGCYTLSQGMSMTTRRPSMLRSSDRLLHCIDQIRATDGVLYCTARLYQIIEEMNEKLRFGSAPNYNDDAVWDRVQHYRRRLTLWFENAALKVMNEPLAMLYYCTVAYLHESVLYSEHRPADFIAPYNFEKVGPTMVVTGPLSGRDESCLAQFISSAHACLNVFISVSPAAIQCLPTGLFLRLLYVAYVLEKIAMSALDLKSVIGRLIDSSVIKADYYRGRVLAQLNAAASQGRCARVQVFCDRLENMTFYWSALAKHLKVAPPGQNVDDVGQDVKGDVVAEARSKEVTPISDSLGWDPMFFEALDPTDIDGTELDQLMAEFEVDWDLLVQ